MTEMTPGLHPHTRPQRKGDAEGWAQASGDTFEPRDAPPKWVGVGIAGLIAALLLSVGAVLWFTSEVRPRNSLHPATAREKFHTEGPVLETEPTAERLILERAHPAPGGTALKAAMESVVRQGWGDPASPSARADTAMKRAGARP
jgi:hypothetical protein